MNPQREALKILTLALTRLVNDLDDNCSPERQGLNLSQVVSLFEWELIKCALIQAEGVRDRLPDC